MKKILYTSMLILAAAFSISSCSEKGKGETTGDVFPVIYTNSWSASMTARKGEEFVLSPVVSPASLAKVEWTLDNMVIGDKAELRWTPDTLGTFTLTINAEYNSYKSLRTTTLTVKKPITEGSFNPEPFTPRPMAYNVMGFFDLRNGDVSTIRWDAISHLIVTGAVVSADASISYPCEQDDLWELVDLAHSKGVYLIMEFAGVYDAVTSKQEAGNIAFYTAACENADKLAETILKYADNSALDGIHIWMDKPTNLAEGYADPAALKKFYQALHSSKPATSKTGQKFMMTYGTFPDVASSRSDKQDEFALMSGWDYIVTMWMCIPATFNTSHAPQDMVKGEVAYWQEKGVDASRIVVTISNVVWAVSKSSVGGTITESNVADASKFFSFKEFIEILEDNKVEEINVKSVNNYTMLKKDGITYDWLRYDGFDWVDTKIKYMTVAPKAGAVALWKIDLDAEGEFSMLGHIKSYLDY